MASVDGVTPLAAPRTVAVCPTMLKRPDIAERLPVDAEGVGQAARHLGDANVEADLLQRSDRQVIVHHLSVGEVGSGDPRRGLGRGGVGHGAGQHQAFRLGFDTDMHLRQRAGDRRGGRGCVERRRLNIDVEVGGGVAVAIDHGNGGVAGAGAEHEQGGGAGGAHFGDLGIGHEDIADAAGDRDDLAGAGLQADGSALNR